MRLPIAFFLAVASVGSVAPKPALAQDLDAQIYELRVYTTHPGKLEHLHARFREHTNHLFVKHGMRLIAYWTPADEDDKLIYVLAFPDAKAREASWQAFRDDPEWQKVYAESHEAAGGPIVENVDSTLMFPTDYSPIR